MTLDPNLFEWRVAFWDDGDLVPDTTVTFKHEEDARQQAEELANEPSPPYDHVEVQCRVVGQWVGEDA